MPAIILTICTVLGISPFRLIMYTGIFIAVTTGVLWVRHHYVAIGYHKAISDVKKQDDRAAAAADAVTEKVAKCDVTNGFWDVITQDCKLQEMEKVK